MQSVPDTRDSISTPRRSFLGDCEVMSQLTDVFMSENRQAFLFDPDDMRFARKTSLPVMSEMRRNDMRGFGKIH
jgi:hypothetical protein